MAVSALKLVVGFVRSTPVSIRNDELVTESRSLSWKGEQDRR